MSTFKRSLLLGSIGVILLAGLMLTSLTRVSSTAFASSCNTVAIGTWQFNCTVSEGNISNFVYAIQETINESYTPCSTSVDGDFGPQTFAAVECFQRNTPGLSVDGIVGPQTWWALYTTLTYASSQPSGGWYYAHGQVYSRNNYRVSATTSIWYIYVGHWCEINLSSPC